MEQINENSKIKAVIFDLDHTLYDRYETLKLICHDLYTEKRDWLSDGVTEEDTVKIILEADGSSIVEGWTAVYEYWTKSGLLKSDKNGTPIAGKKDMLEFILNYGFLKHAVKYPFANPMLDELRDAGLKVGLITNAAGEKGVLRQNTKLKLLDMTDRFDSVIISGAVGVHKPCRTVFDIMKWRLGIPSENMLYVGDNPKNDVNGSKTAGYVPVWVRIREEYGETADCEYSVKDVSELPALIDKINSEDS